MFKRSKTAFATVMGLAAAPLILVACAGGAEPTPTPFPAVTRSDLPGMVLTQSEIEAEFPGQLLDDDASGFQDNEAEGTIDPDDTASDIADRGRIDGYDHGFLDLSVMSEGQKGRPFAVFSGVDLFDTPDSAQAFLQREFKDYNRFQGIDLDERTFTDFQAAAAPDLGSDPVAGVLTVSMEASELELTILFFWWRRGPILALVAVSALDKEDRSAALERLARLMNDRIDGVLA